jgi:uncharacterized membrane protein
VPTKKESKMTEMITWQSVERASWAVISIGLVIIIVGIGIAMVAVAMKIGCRQELSSSTIETHDTFIRDDGQRVEICRHKIDGSLECGYIGPSAKHDSDKDLK